MEQYIDKAAIVAEIERLIDSHKPLKTLDPTYCEGLNDSLDDILSFLDTLEVKDSNETAEEFARIIRANLTGIDKDVQYKFEQLYKKITGEKMYQGYND